MTKSIDQKKTTTRIHVEATIAAPLAAVVAATQTPEQHVRWDSRFAAIRPVGSRGRWTIFRYETRLAGLRLSGTGANVLRGRTSVLRFAGTPPAPIARGAGFWRYVEVPGGTRFVTQFDYTPGFGRVGALLDRAFVRRLFARMTARSFDRLRLWLEDGIEPESLQGRLRPRARNVEWWIGRQA